MMRLYEYDKPGKMIETVNGFITYAQWLENEKARIERRPGRQCEVRTKGDKVALFVDQVAGWDHRRD